MTGCRSPGRCSRTEPPSTGVAARVGGWTHARDARSAGPRRLPPRARDGPDHHARRRSANFAALKTYDPPVDALVGAEITGGLAARQVHRPGDHDPDARFRAAPDLPPREGGLAALVRPAALDAHPAGQDADRAARRALSDGSGFDLTEAGTKKSLAVYVVRDPQDVPGIARLGPDPLEPTFTRDTLAGLIEGRRTQIKGVLRDQIDPRRGRQRVLGRDPARRAACRPTRWPRA